MLHHLFIVTNISISVFTENYNTVKHGYYEFQGTYRFSSL